MNTGPFKQIRENAAVVTNGHDRHCESVLARELQSAPNRSVPDFTQGTRLSCWLKSNLSNL
jgi:hypothetical protein